MSTWYPTHYTPCLLYPVYEIINNNTPEKTNEKETS